MQIYKKFFNFKIIYKIIYKIFKNIIIFII